MLTNIFDFTGNTPIIKLKHLDYEIFAKLEYFNPFGSIKDRIVKYILDEAITKGEINENTTIIEATSGNTGMAVAAYAACHGLRAILVISDKMSQEKIDAIKAFGAKVVLVSKYAKAGTENSYRETAKRLAAETPNSFYLNQYNNINNRKAHEVFIAPEILNQIKDLDLEINAIFIGIGTAGTISGIGCAIKKHRPDIKIIGVDAEGSILEENFKSGRISEEIPYEIEGIGSDSLIDNLDWSVVDDVISVGDLESFEMARYLVRTNAIFAGGSSGAAVAACVKYSKLHDLKWKMLAIMPDHGSRYLSKFYSDAWFENFKSSKIPNKSIE